MEFRKAELKDIPSLVSMRILYSLETYGGFSTDFKKRMEEELPVYFERHLDKDLTAYIALENLDVVSTALLLIAEKPINPALTDGRTGIVLNVFTKPEYRGKGLATKLMEMLLYDAKREGLDYVELKATECGYPLYKKLGFSEKKSANIYMTYNFGR